MNNKRIILIVVCVVVIIAAGLIYYFVQNPNSISKNPNVEEEYIGLRVPGIEIDGQTIEFPYTDENEGESIIIKSDKEIYEGSGVSDVYFSLTNTGNKPEKIAILSYFPIEYGDISHFDVWQNGHWERMQIVRGDIKANMSKLEKAFAKRKPVPKEFNVKAGTQFEIPADHTAYFKSEIKYPMGKRGEFWFEAFGDGGGYGLLDPIFIGRATSSDTTPGWYQTGATPWDYRRAVTVDESKVSGTSDLSNFPMLVYFSATDLKHTSFGGKVASSSAGITGGGGDFVFTSSNGTTKLDHEIEKYSSSSGELWAWVEVPTLSVTADTPIYMYYGGPSSGATNQNKTGVWDANYKGVYHLPSGTTLTADDSTSNANNGTLVNTPTATSGQIDGAANFVSGSSQKITVNDHASLDPTANVTASAWVKSTTTGTFLGIVDKYTGDTSGYLLDIPATDRKPRFTTFTGGNDSTTATINVQDGQWHYLTGTYDGSNTKIYVDGSLSSSVAASGNVNDNAGAMAIGGDGVSTNYLTGVVDEVRISLSTRSSDWIKTEYNNQYSPKTFYSVGGLQYRIPNTTKYGSMASSDTTPGWYSASGNNWSYRKKLAIDKNKVSGTSDLSNFPFLVYLSDANIKHTSFSGNVASSSAGVTGGGGDFVFTSSNGTTKLDHEIEKYSSSSGELWAWVEVPTLSVTADTPIYMYYGGPSSGATNQNPTGVWDANYIVVIHLPNTTGTLTARDSTSNADHGTVTSATTVSGKIAGGAEMDGTNDYITIPDQASLDWPTTLTVNAWFYKDVENSSYYDLVDTANRTLHLSIQNSTSGWQSIDGSNHSWTGISGFTAGTWHHLTFTRNSNDLVSTYLNGKLVTTFTDTNTQTNGNDVVIGDSPSGGAVDWDGKVDEFRLSNIARSSDWSKTEYNNQSKPKLSIITGGQEARVPTTPGLQFK